MPVLIIYSLVIVFLLAFPLLVLSFAQQPDTSSQTQQATKNATKNAAISYGLVLAFFVVFSLLTFVTHRSKT